MSELKVGNVIGLSGNVTTLIFIKPGHERDMEHSLGYGEGRLSQGYFIALLRQPLTVRDFKLAGYSYFSGGRIGKPAKTTARDRLREHLQDSVLREYGMDGVLQMKRIAQKGMDATGSRRIAKVLPMIRHNPAMSPAEQYPVGHGVPQFELVRERMFLVAAEVTLDGTVITPDFQVNVREQGYEARRRLRVYLEAA